MQEVLDALQQEKLSLERSVSELQANVSKLEEQARELKEREKLLVFFPELHVPTETQFESKRAVGSGICFHLRGLLELARDSDSPRHASVLCTTQFCPADTQERLGPWAVLSRCHLSTPPSAGAVCSNSRLGNKAGPGHRLSFFHLWGPSTPQAVLVLPGLGQPPCSGGERAGSSGLSDNVFCLQALAA